MYLYPLLREAETKDSGPCWTVTLATSMNSRSSWRPCLKKKKKKKERKKGNRGRQLVLTSDLQTDRHRERERQTDTERERDRERGGERENAEMVLHKL